MRPCRKGRVSQKKFLCWGSFGFDWRKKYMNSGQSDDLIIAVNITAKNEELLAVA